MPRKKSGAVDTILFQGVKTNNLKNIDIELPKNKLITVTGVSGSGKSSFAFGTVYKEGQYRYIESLSSYLRQFFQLGDRPTLDYSEGLSPAIAIEQNKRVGNMRSTVGTLTEIDDYLRLLFAKVGEAYDYVTGERIQTQTTPQILEQIHAKFADQKIYLLEEIKYFTNQKQLDKRRKNNRHHADQGNGFVRILIARNTKAEKGTKLDSLAGKTAEYFYLEDPHFTNDDLPITVFGIYDRLTVNEETNQRLHEDIIRILSESKKFGVYSTENEELGRYTDKNFCPTSNIEYPDFTTQHFSPNRQEGACPTCRGTGETLQVDYEMMIDQESLYLDAILPRRDSHYGQQILTKLAKKYDMKTKVKRKELDDRYKDIVLNGDNEKLRISLGNKYVRVTYEGVESILTQQYQKGLLTVDFQAMLQLKECPTCNGTKLRIESLHVKLPIGENYYNIADMQYIPINTLVTRLSTYQKESKEDTELVGRIITPLLNRVKTITDLGLGYINTSRKIDTLSGGEIQRLRLAKQLGNKLTGITYVLDEPTIGLDDGEIKKAIVAIKKLRDMGNTIIVVEHNEAFIVNSDRIVEIGPGAGDYGGELLYNGPYDAFIEGDTQTAAYVSGRKQVTVDFTHSPSTNKITIRKASKYNLQEIDTEIPLGSFTIITGSSGAGKTTLMYHTLFRFLKDKNTFVQSFIRLHMLRQGMSRSDIIAKPVLKPAEFEHFQNLALQDFYKEIGVESIVGREQVENVLYVNQSGIGKTPRSCPATFIGVFDDIRKIFAGQETAKLLGFTPGHFSFNSNKGACPECNGYGYKKIELQFLPDTYVNCDLCQGKRYKSDILQVKRNGKTIADVLQMYIHEAAKFFKEIPSIGEQVALVEEIGLGYLKFGQPAHTLSGGESQRLKLVKHLLKTYRGHTLYFLDEPTVGLHPADIERLLKVLKRFLENGDTILMIEHDQSLLQYADKIIHLDHGALLENVNRQ